ncbi:MAG: hypothetical protein HC937_02585 [Aquincola sp.]|nr:hypothetical protein [Aquincola sp.]
MSLIDTKQDLSLVGLTWRRRVGVDGKWTNQIYRRANKKTSAEGEAYPDLVPIGTLASAIPVRERLMTVTEKETEIWLAQRLCDSQPLRPGIGRAARLADRR